MIISISFHVSSYETGKMLWLHPSPTTKKETLGTSSLQESAGIVLFAFFGTVIAFWLLWVVNIEIFLTVTAFWRSQVRNAVTVPNFLIFATKSSQNAVTVPKNPKKPNSRGLLKAAWTPRVSGNWVFWVFWDSYSILATFNWKYWEIWDSHSILHPWA